MDARTSVTEIWSGTVGGPSDRSIHSRQQEGNQRHLLILQPRLAPLRTPIRCSSLFFVCSSSSSSASSYSWPPWLRRLAFASNAPSLCNFDKASGKPTVSDLEILIQEHVVEPLLICWCCFYRISPWNVDNWSDAF